MKKPITRARARKLLGCKTNPDLADRLECTRQQVYQWREHDPIPRPRQWQVRMMVAEERLKK